MSDPTNENAGATPPESPPAGEAPVAPDAAPAQDQVAAATAAEQPTAPMPAAVAAPTAAAPAGPHEPWHRRRWAVITGAVIAAAILFFGGMAVGAAIGDRGGRGFAHHGRKTFPGGGQGFGHEGWGDNGSGQGMMPGQGGQGFGQGGNGWDQGGNGYGQPQAPNTTPAPSTSPQALTQ